ncbi:mechanosensitive ion channel family protein [Pseudomonadota bacterium]
MDYIKKLFTESIIQPYIEPLIFILGGLIIGLIIQKLVISRLRTLSEKTKWKGDDIIIEGLGKAPVLWFILAGMYASIYKLLSQVEYQQVSQQIISILLILSVAIVISRISSGFIGLYTQKTAGEGNALSLLTNMAKIVIYILAILIILQSMGISITPILTALGVGGLAVALALQETLSNLFSGIQLIASKKIKPGDYVQLETLEEGFITDITWRNTTIRTLGNNLIILPNSKIAGATLTNYSRPRDEMSVLVECGVSYKSDLEKVEAVTIEVGKEIMNKVEGGVSEFEPFIRFNTFNESSIDFKVILRGQEHVSQYRLKHEFIKALHKRYKEEGIEIPFPQRDVHMDSAAGAKAPVTTE